MKWSLFLALVSIGLVAGNGAWKENLEYKYKMVDKTWYKLPSDSKETGIIAKVLLTIRPKSEDILVGKITQTLVTRASDSNDSDNDSKSSSSSSSSSSAEDNVAIRSALKDLPLNKKFHIFLVNGVIRTLALDPKVWNNDQINQLKYILSQLQVDTRGEHLVRPTENYQLPNAKSNNAYYKTMEPTVAGVCDTNYDISRVPEYLAYAKYATIPSLAKYASGEDVIEVVKQMDLRTCTQYDEIFNGIRVAEQDAMINSKVIITGSVDSFTIHSSVFTHKSAGVSKFAYMTLESVERKDSNDDDDKSDDSLQNIGMLVYKSDHGMTRNFINNDDDNDSYRNQRVGDKQWTDRTSDYKMDVRLNTDSEDNYKYNYNPRFANRANIRNFDNKADTRVIRDSNES